MLFRKKIDPRCGYCQYCAKLNDEQVLCIKHGIRTVDKKCSKFRYDPCKRIPSRAKSLDFKKYDTEDYSL